MSYVISIERRTSTAPLTSLDINRVVDADESFTRHSEALVEWRDPSTSKGFCLNIEEDSLWTDAVHGDEDMVFLTKLQELAVALGADVVGEEGELLTDTTVPADTEVQSVLSAIAGFGLVAITLPVLALMFVIRLPWIVWKILRSTKS